MLEWEQMSAFQGSESSVSPGGLWGECHFATEEFPSLPPQHPSWSQTKSLSNACHVHSHERIWNEWQKWLQLIKVTEPSNSCSSLFMSWEYFCAALSKTLDAEVLSFSTHCTDGECSNFFLCKNTETMFILALDAFTSWIMSETKSKISCSSLFN